MKIRRRKRYITKLNKLYYKEIAKSKLLPKGWKLYKSFRSDSGSHPIDYKLMECAFVSSSLNIPMMSKVLNVGSYSLYVAGILSMYKVVSLDIRERPSLMDTEKVVVMDAKELNLQDNYFDAIISTSSIEHFGLGRYGDDLDLNADKKAFNQFKRVLKPGGLLIFTTTIKKGSPEICFNANKNYTQEIIDSFSEGFVKEKEMYINKQKLEFCIPEEITNKPMAWDIYCGCWRKK